MDASTRLPGHPDDHPTEKGLQRLGRHDPKKPRKGQRAGKEKGVRLYIAADELRAAGIDPDGPAPTFRVWANKSGRGSLLVRLYSGD